MYSTKQEELLECILTDKELMIKADELARLNQEKTRLDNEKKATVSEFAAKINTCDAGISRLSLAISTKRESRTVDCEIRYNDPNEGIKTIVRLDTGDNVRQLVMTENEKSDMFINATGEQDLGFVFNNKLIAAIVNKEDLTTTNQDDWDSVGPARRAEDLVQAIIDKDMTYRVIKGSNDDGDGFLYMLQKNKIKEVVNDAKEENPEKDKKPNTEKDLTPQKEDVFRFVGGHEYPILESTKELLLDTEWTTAPGSPHQRTQIQGVTILTEEYDYRVLRDGQNFTLQRKAI